MPRDPKQHQSDQWNKIEKHILRSIDERGWFVMGVFQNPGDKEPGWSYSIGLFYNYHHPEIVIFGEQPELRQSMIDAIGERVREGEKFTEDRSYADILGGGHYVQFRPVDVSHYEDWVNSANWFYDWDHASFPLLQCFYPDMTGKFPWEPGCEKWAVEAQPLLHGPKP